jgi:YidC/Oxa1 family membrane protein insertase
MMDNQKNTLLAIVLSGLVLLLWQFFIANPQMEKQRQIAQEQAEKRSQTPPVTPGTAPAPQQPSQQAPGVPQPPAQPSATAPSITAAPPQPASRDSILAATPRVRIETPTLAGSISLKGGRIDDLSLVKYREKIEPNSPAIILFSPSGSQEPFYAEFGWVAGSGAPVKVPAADTVWKQEGSGSLGVGQTVKLVYDNGEGLEFRRTIAVDDKYLFTVTDEVANKGSAPVTLFPYSLISRHGTPQTLGYYILHEGLIGVLGDQGLQEIGYSDVEKKKEIRFDVVNGWLGITDKYWAAALLPDPAAKLAPARFSAGMLGNQKTYQADYLLGSVTVAPGSTGAANARLFAGAKEVTTVDGYDKALKLNRFELLIDWGWFYFITKPVFWALDWFFKLTGNFGIAILLITVVVKVLFLPLANKSYASMAKMKAVQPKMMEIKERWPDDKVKQQQAMMELYKAEKINPLAGCLPIAIQIPVFYSLYKVLFVTIEMRHAPFFGWIRDLSGQDPTNVFNLFGLIPFDPTVIPAIGPFLHLGIWPIIMGITMWFQMKLNPAPPDPTQKMIFDWMPVLFTFMLASFPAGLVIYWAWNNILSVGQQAFIMQRHGAKIELIDNLKGDIGKLFGRKDDDNGKKDDK